MLGIRDMSVINTAPNDRLPIHTCIEAWDKELIREAVTEAAECVQGFLVLCGEIEGEQQDWRFQSVAVDWPLLASVEKPCWLTFRIHSRALDQTQWTPETVARLTRTFLEKAQKSDLAVQGLQIDYDAATERLPQYRDWLQQLRKELPDLPLSITGLPDWLNHKSLPGLVSDLDGFVLQLHSLQLSEDSRQEPCIFDSDKAWQWIRQAKALKIPFTIALPTYGWRLIFDQYGRQRGMEAETTSALPPGWRAKEIASDALELSAFLRQLKEELPPELKGIHWFRMPLPSDRRNWSLQTLKAVMEGTATPPEYEVEVRWKENNLVELWISAAPDAGTTELCVHLELVSAQVLASDLVNGFREIQRDEKGIMIISGPVDRGRARFMAGWWLLIAGEQEEAPSLSVKEIGSCP